MVKHISLNWRLLSHLISPHTMSSYSSLKLFIRSDSGDFMKYMKSEDLSAWPRWGLRSVRIPVAILALAHWMGSPLGAGCDAYHLKTQKIRLSKAMDSFIQWKIDDPSFYPFMSFMGEKKHSPPIFSYRSSCNISLPVMIASIFHFAF